MNDRHSLPAAQKAVKYFLLTVFLLIVEYYLILF